MSMKKGMQSSVRSRSSLSLACGGSAQLDSLCISRLLVWLHWIRICETVKLVIVKLAKIFAHRFKDFTPGPYRLVHCCAMDVERLKIPWYTSVVKRV